MAYSLLHSPAEDMVIVAIPKYKEDIAPCFEAAAHFLITTVEGGKRISSNIIQCGGLSGIKRIRMLRDCQVGILICNGIKTYFRNVLEAAGIRVISNIEDPVLQALEKFIKGDLPESTVTTLPPDDTESVILDELINWSKEYFENRGFGVKIGPDIGPFPIDLIAELPCPVCCRPIRVAICCGAHMYRADQEVREFHHVTGSDFHARVYIRRITPQLADCCQEYGIEIIDPSSGRIETSRKKGEPAPVLGHLLGLRETTRPKRRV